MRSRFVLILFLILSVIHLLLIQIGSDFTVFTKPLLILSLLGYYVLECRSRKGIVILALIACWIGDCLLMFTDRSPNFFLAGLVAFLTGHVLYIIGFRMLTNPLSGPIRGEVYLLSFIPFICAGWLITTLWPDLGSFKWPVVVYTAVIAAMFIHAVRRMNRTNGKSFWLLTVGALLFMISDSLLAYNMFGSPIPFSGLLVMSTYLGAQFLIVKGILTHEN